MQSKRLMARLSVLAEELRCEGNEDLASRVEWAIHAIRRSDTAYRLRNGDPGDEQAAPKPDA